MHRDEREVLQTLRNELEFLSRGGYRRSHDASWRPAFIFEDSPICPNRENGSNPLRCGECPLMQFVPPERRQGRLPCRTIPLNSSGETLDSLYRSADPQETEQAVRDWLNSTIRQLEERSLAKDLEAQPDDQEKVCDRRSLRIIEKPSIAKCANPACSVAFRWLEGGKFFSLRPKTRDSQGRTEPDDSTRKPPPGTKYFWLCERCTHVFTLEVDETRGVMLKLLFPELPLAETARNPKNAA